jgi:hypothetical protein
MLSKITFLFFAATSCLDYSPSRNIFSGSFVSGFSFYAPHPVFILWQAKYLLLVRYTIIGD